MPVYEYHCEKCDREVTITLTISQHEKGKIERPQMRQQSSTATAQRLHVSDIEEVLIRARSANPTGRRSTSAPLLRAGQAISSARCPQQIQLGIQRRDPSGEGDTTRADHRE